MQLVLYPDDKLRVKTSPVGEVTPELIEKATDMYALMLISNGIGLSAPQVGLDISLIVLEDNGGPLILFNPVILQRSKDTEYSTEGCLSFPDVWRLIKRPKEVTIKYRGINGKMQYAVLKGIQARCFCHEYDHLNGKLFIDLEEQVK